MTATRPTGPSSFRDGSRRSLVRLLGAAIIIIPVGTLGGCAGQSKTAAGTGYSASASVQVVRVIDNEFLRDPAAAGAGSARLERPIALAIASNGDMVIADQGTGQILKTDAQGTLLATAAYFDPRGLSMTRAPRFVRVDYTGNVCVSDAVNAGITIYDSHLRPVSSLAPPYDALELPEGSVSGLAFGAYGEFYLTDVANGRVFRFDASGRFLAEFPGAGESLAQLNRPMGLDCADLDGSVYVCESGNAQIAVYDNLGVPVRTFGGSDLKDPVAIALDRQGHCFVADAGLRAVVVFTREGRFIDRIGADRIGFADFGGPTDVAVSDSTLYIADPSHGRILQIRFGAERPAP